MKKIIVSMGAVALVMCLVFVEDARGQQIGSGKGGPVLGGGFGAGWSPEVGAVTCSLLFFLDLDSLGSTANYKHTNPDPIASCRSDASKGKETMGYMLSQTKVAGVMVKFFDKKRGKVIELGVTPPKNYKGEVTVSNMYRFKKEENRAWMYNVIRENGYEPSELHIKNYIFLPDTKLYKKQLFDGCKDGGSGVVIDINTGRPACDKYSNQELKKFESGTVSKPNVNDTSAAIFCPRKSKTQSARKSKGTNRTPATALGIKAGGCIPPQPKEGDRCDISNNETPDNFLYCDHSIELKWGTGFYTKDTSGGPRCGGKGTCFFCGQNGIVKADPNVPLSCRPTYLKPRRYKSEFETFGLSCDISPTQCALDDERDPRQKDKPYYSDPYPRGGIGWSPKRGGFGAPVGGFGAPAGVGVGFPGDHQSTGHRAQ